MKRSPLVPLELRPVVDISPATQQKLREAFQALLAEVTTEADAEHIADTPSRVVKAYAELMSGVDYDPASVLKVGFKEAAYNELVSVVDIDFVSLCMHHLLPFYGQAHFAYLPNKYIVGLSKIPRMVEILARRPQIQERLTQQIVDVFQHVVKPRGCGVVVEAWHACAAIRGVRQPNVRMRTTALRGWFLQKPHLKEEFLATALHRNSL